MLQHVQHVKQVFQCLWVQKKLVDCGLLGEDQSQADTKSNVAYCSSYFRPPKRKTCCLYLFYLTHFSPESHFYTP